MNDVLKEELKAIPGEAEIMAELEKFSKEMETELNSLAEWAERELHI